MVLSYILLGISGFGLIAIGMNHYLHFLAHQHITLDIFVSLVFLAGQTLVMFFFVGTGVNVREYSESQPELGDQFIKEMLGLKRSLYPPTMLTTIVFMIMVILDGVFFMGRISEWWFHILYPLSFFLFVRSTLVQHKSFVGSTHIVLSMTKSFRK
ncbi:MAG: hypothetical protein HOD97_08115 [Candidatus Marinimicrobia bacterium]|nr:hypothetical protein [Candidatus Neomarinimicrobiota bacterium]MBT3617363.1 hypothetical protein [Candidatus Neomarinimicrobiota bacterium]MBT3829303.1 hypothetical protein [Candidatus Neomarinimicrobiota bacterium]MBT4281562.1 hypothetical protein [Candidatus Neomarinimicrobiota bacterium]MBT4570370.1 hypothetical protein [Candidatus Neomarinimicrobiota bacterium]